MVICCYIDLTTIQYNNTLSHDQCSRYKEHLLYKSKTTEVKYRRATFAREPHAIT